jgi:hypothetical protein
MSQGMKISPKKESPESDHRIRLSVAESLTILKLGVLATYAH